jgi:site-specific recombinase XerD
MATLSAIAQPVMTLDGFAAHLAQTCGSRHTSIRYLADGREFVAFLDGRRVSVAVVEAWAAALNLGARRPQTVSRKLSAVRRLLGFLAARGDEAAKETLVILRDYRVCLPIREGDVREVRSITATEYAALREQLPQWGMVLADLLWASGARISEVVGDPVAGIRHLTVADGLRLVTEGFTTTTGKRGRRRVLVIPSAAREILRPFVEARSSAAGSDAPLFASPDDSERPVSAQAFNSLLRSRGNTHAHALRHGFRARCRQAGLSDEIQRALMGHHAGSVTQGYGRVTIPEMLEAVERLGVPS